jgi:bifunctional UDP-N-acetylglucosamine pyrophosphorylase/glucosamine-1-phosphate N-acetyltransferase
LDKTLIKHFSYLGDSRIGRGVNIGAGTITANFDGRRKNISIIKDKALIGSDTVLVAPVTVGRKAVTGAGAVVTAGSKIKDNSLVVGIPAKPMLRKKNSLRGLTKKR